MIEEIKLNTDQTIIWHNPSSIFKYCGWPSVCRDERGTLFVTASAFRIQHVDPCGKNAMWISRDEGKTWSKPIIINDSRMDDRDTGIISLGGGHMIATWFSCCFGDPDNGSASWMYCEPQDREMILAHTNVVKYMDEKYRKNGCYVAVSDDYGLTWSDPITVPMSAPHGANAMKGGRAVFLGKENASGEGKVCCYISSDYGRTWEEKGIVTLYPGYGWGDFHEPHVVELPNGRLFGAIRSGCNGGHEACCTTYSDDEGVTWSEPKFVGVYGIPPHLFVHSSGALIMSYCNRENRTERALVSHDFGETWSEDYVLDDKNTFCDLGYPATTELGDGSLFTVYYQAVANENFPCVMGCRWQLQK